MTISDIAQMAGVSRATVSRYLNNGYVSTANREKIAEIIKKTGFVPSSHAQIMRTKKSGIIGVIAPKISSESISRTVSGISSKIDGTSYNILLGNTNYNLSKELEFLHIFKRNRVEGIILIPTTITSAHYRIIKSLGTPVVIAGQDAQNISCVYHDDFGASKEAVTHLINNGAKKIAMLCISSNDKAAGESRLNGYLNALSDNGIMYGSKLVRECEQSSEDAYNSMNALYAEHPDIDAVFCAADIIAVGAMSALKNSDKGKNVKIISIGGSKISGVLDLSTVMFHYYTCGAESCRILLESINGSCIPRKIMLGYEMIERGSTNPDKKQTE